MGIFIQSDITRRMIFRQEYDMLELRQCTRHYIYDDFVVQYVGYKLSDPDKVEEIKEKLESELHLT